MTGVSICLFPFSWHVGVKRIREKTLFAVGPFRLCVHRTRKQWRDY